MAEFELEITTPERQFLKEPVQMVILPGENGELGVMAGHAPLVLVLKSGTVRIKQNDEWRECVTADGYAMVDRKRVLLLCQMAEWPEEIDERLAREEEAREKEKLRQAQSQRVVAVDEGIAQIVVLVAELQGRAFELDALLHAHLLRKAACGVVADDHLQGNDLHLLHSGLAVI